MPIGKQKATASGTSEVPPAGNHPAVLVAMIDLGTHMETFKDDKKGTSKDALVHKLFLCWELVTEKMSGMKDVNHVIAREYNATFSPKSKFRLMIEGWRGKAFSNDEEFDPKKLLGQKCLISVKHKTSQQGNEYAQIDGVAPVPKGMVVPAGHRAPLLYEIGDKVPPTQDWLPFTFYNGERVPVMTVIERSREYMGGYQPQAAPARNYPAATQAPVTDAEIDDEIPF